MVTLSEASALIASAAKKVLPPMVCQFIVQAVAIWIQLAIGAPPASCWFGRLARIWISRGRVVVTVPWRKRVRVWVSVPLESQFRAAAPRCGYRDWLRRCDCPPVVLRRRGAGH